MHTQFIEYAREGNILELDNLVARHSSQIQDMVSADDFSAFREAATNGHLTIIARLIELVPDQVSEMLSARNFSAFGEAAADGHLLVIELLVGIPRAPIQAMIRADDFYGFCGAAANGHIPVINRLIELAPELMTDMLSARALSAFCGAAANGHIPVIDRLIELAPELKTDMLSARDFSAFCQAAANGHIPVINKLIELSPELIIDMLSARDFSAFCTAAANGHLPVINKLIELAPELMTDMLSAHDFYAFREAAANGHLPVINKLIELAPDQVREKLSTHSFHAFREAAENGHLTIIERLLQFAPEQIPGMLSADDFFAFCTAAANGHLLVIEQLVQLPQAPIQDMISAYNFDGFSEAAANGHVKIVERLMELAADQIYEMLRANNFYAFHEAVANGHHEVVIRLLHHPFMFNYAERQGEYTQFLKTTVHHVLMNLSIQIAAFNPLSQTGVFDVTNREEVKLYFYMMRHLIRQNSEDSLDQFNFLLTLPSLKAEAHLGETLQDSNELLRLAMSIDNHQAVEILLDIPSVRAAFQEANHHGHWQEQGFGFNLDAVIHDRESSMNGLSSEEEKRLGKAMAVYQPKVAKRGVLVIMEDLKACMSAHYAKLPAMLTTEEGRLIPLPLEFQEFAQERLSPADRAQALRSYYQHPVHTAYRLTSKPNLWMHHDAQHVIRDEDGRAWSTFEDFQELIALLYLAAIDEAHPPIDDYSIETRVEQFFIELALIGRAHNWDATDREEEYDDLEADQPSCYGGFRKRLLQSVKGHPLLDMLSETIIDIDICRIVKNHFISRITDDNCEALHHSWMMLYQGVFDAESSASSSPLNELDLSPIEIEEHIVSIREKYGTRLDQALEHYLRRRFEIHFPFRNFAEKFGGKTNLSAILDEKLQTLRQAGSFEQTSSVACSGFFQQYNPETDHNAEQTSSLKKARRQ